MKSMKTEVTLTQVNVRIKISLSWPTNMQNEVNKTPFRKAYLCIRHEYAERWLTGHIILKPGFHSRWLYLPHLGTLHGGNLPLEAQLRELQNDQIRVKKPDCPNAL